MVFLQCNCTDTPQGGKWYWSLLMNYYYFLQVSTGPWALHSHHHCCHNQVPIMMKYLNLAFLWSSLAFLVQGQRTPTISYISASMRTKQGGTIEMDCSTLYATEYPILWVKLPGDGCTDRKNFDFRSSVADTCTPVPLSSGSALIVRDNRFRYNKWLYFVYCIGGFPMKCENFYLTLLPL